MRRRIPTALIGILLLAGCESEAEGSGVIFMYHHVDDGTPAATSVTPEVFAEQMDFLEREGFTVVPLAELLDALAGGRDVPSHSVAITFDDGYRSVLTEALPQLESRGWPFTVFVNTEAIDEGFGGYLSWPELRTLGERGGSIGNHSVTHAHLVRRLPDETDDQWRRRVTAEIDDAAGRLEAEVGDYLIPAFAYPYGEYTAEIKAVVERAGLYGLGQHSGAVGAGSDFLALPRYPVATGLPIGEFELRARSRPLPVRIGGPELHVLEQDDTRPTLTLILEADEDVRAADLACYVGGQGRATLEWRDDDMRELSVRPAQALGPGRTKINCTAPSREAAGVYYWYGYLWMRRMADGRWYEE